MDQPLFYKIADGSFLIFHILLILFNLFGWIFEPLRKWNLATLSLTAFSWIILGLFYGFGYCFLTDWHWRIRETLGETIESNSYIHFLILEITSISMNEKVVDLLTVSFFVIACVMSVFLNIRDRSKHKK